MMYNITLARVLYVGLDCIQFRSFKVREVLAIVRECTLLSAERVVVFGVMSARNGAAAKKMPPTVVSRVSAGLLRERPWRDGGDAEPTTDPVMLHTRIQRPAGGHSTTVCILRGVGVASTYERVHYNHGYYVPRTLLLLTSS